jgi:hypothetical protein
VRRAKLLFDSPCGIGWFAERAFEDAATALTTNRHKFCYPDPTSGKHSIAGQ